MKTKALILIAAAAIATLSFVSVNTNNQPPQNSTVKTASKTPNGGFMSEDKL